jgi:hypothetical protein
MHRSAKVLIVRQNVLVGLTWHADIQHQSAGVPLPIR